MEDNNSFSLPKNEIFSPAVFNILREPIIVQNKLYLKKKSWFSAFWVLKTHRRGIVKRAPRLLAIKSIFEIRGIRLEPTYRCHLKCLSITYLPLCFSSKSWIAFQSRNSKTMATVNIILRLWFILCRHDLAKSTMTNQILTIVCFLYFFCLSIFSSQFNLLPSALCHPVITCEQGLTQLLLHLKNWQFVHH